MKTWVFVAVAIAIVVLIVLFMPIEKPPVDKEGETQEAQQTENLSPTYPEHPSIQDCEKTEKRNFCLADVAEMNSDVNVCEMIGDPDVKTFCVARVLLNETMCKGIIEEGLKGSCRESVEMKKSWLGIK